MFVLAEHINSLDRERIVYCVVHMCVHHKVGSFSVGCCKHSQESLPIKLLQASAMIVSTISHGVYDY